MQPPRPTDIAHQILRDHIRPGDTVVDATAGNGHDTVFLAEAVGETGTVHAIDLQAQAIASARERITTHGFSGRVRWHTGNHRDIGGMVSGEEISTIVFNLGYLPGNDHQTTTTEKSTLAALKSSAALLLPGGMLSVLCYPGHAEGKEEAKAVEQLWPAWTDEGWRIACYTLPFTKRPSPVLWIATKPPSLPQ